MKTICREQYALDAANIDRMPARFQEKLAALGIGKRECLRLRLSLEEILLNWLERKAGEEVRLLVEGNRRKLHIWPSPPC